MVRRWLWPVGRSIDGRCSQLDHSPHTDGHADEPSRLPLNGQSVGRRIRVCVKENVAHTVYCVQTSAFARRSVALYGSMPWRTRQD